MIYAAQKLQQKVRIHTMMLQARSEYPLMSIQNLKGAQQIGAHPSTNVTPPIRTYL